MEIGNIEIPVLVVGIVQVVKLLFEDLSTKGKIVIALAVGIILLSIAQALPYIGDSASIVIVSFVRILGYAIAIPGWFGVIKDDLLGC